jgi:hypothetical protein
MFLRAYFLHYLFTFILLAALSELSDTLTSPIFSVILSDKAHFANLPWVYVINNIVTQTNKNKVEW